MICLEEILSMPKIPVKDSVIFVVGSLNRFCIKIHNERCGFYLILINISLKID